MTTAAPLRALPDLSGLPDGTVVVHGGMHKTGTSSIQNTLAAAGEELRAAGWLYPRSGLVDDPHTGYRHWTLMEELRHGRPPVSWQALRAELDRWDGRALVSHENLFSPQVDPQRVVQELGGRPVVLLAWLRHPVDYLESCYREWTRRWGWTVAPDAYLQRREPYLRVAPLVRAWERAVGEQNVVLRAYERERLVGGSTVEDALALLGLPDLPRAPDGANESLNTRQVLVQRVANLVGVPLDDEMRGLFTALLADPATRAAALAGLPAQPGPGWSALRLTGLRVLLTTPFPERARLLGDATVAAVEAAHLEPTRAVLRAHGAPDDVLARSTYGRLPLDPTFLDDHLVGAAAALWR